MREVHPLAIGQYVSLKSLEGQDYNTFLIRRTDLEGKFYGNQCREYACGDVHVKQEDVLETTGQHHNVHLLELQNEAGHRAARAELEPYTVYYDGDGEDLEHDCRTLGQARAFAANKGNYEIWHKGRRIEFCEDYEGDDDRVKQALGIPNASEA